MKRWLLLSLIPMGVLLLAAGALLLQRADQAEADIVSGDSLSCPASGGSGDALVVAPHSAGTSLTTTDTAADPFGCWFVGTAVFPDGCGSGDLYVDWCLCHWPYIGWFELSFPHCPTCGNEWDSVSDYRYWEVCTWPSYCEGEWVEWELFAVHDVCPLAYDDKAWVNWLRHGMTWLHYVGKNHYVLLAPQWGTEVEYGPFWDRKTTSLGACSPEVGSGCDGYTTEETCTGPIITDNLTWDGCGRVDRAFVDPEFRTYGYIWCVATGGVRCTTYGIRLDVDWTG